MNNMLDYTQYLNEMDVFEYVIHPYRLSVTSIIPSSWNLQVK